MLEKIVSSITACVYVLNKENIKLCYGNKKQDKRAKCFVMFISPAKSFM